MVHMTKSIVLTLLVLTLLQLHASAQTADGNVNAALRGSAAEIAASRVVSKLLQDKNSRVASATNDEWTPVSSVEGQQFVSPQIDKDFFLEVETALGSKLIDSSRDRLEDITNGLRPTFESLEKNEYGKLGHTAVRYALHRLFLARHGWQMKGLDPAGQRFSSSSPVEVLQGKASLHVRGIFEKRLSGQGFGLQELAVFASVLEEMISQEAGDRLRALLEKPSLSQDTPDDFDEEKVEKLVELYLTAFILGKDIKEVPEDELFANWRSMPDAYSYWHETQKLARKVRAEVLGSRNSYTITDITTMLVELGERFGKFTGTECKQMKEKLVKLEADEEGCVPIESFYKPSVSSRGADWQFGESIDYLKTNGIIDEANPKKVNVMLANYMNGPANCIAASRYYSVCCIDECEALLGHIEFHVRAPTATPEKLASLMAALPSSTVPANRTLPPAQSHRLYRIAEMHGGRVPIHGRLFMQWMHMVYPRECSYPHLSGTKKSLTAKEWEKQTGKDNSATQADMQTVVETSTQGSVEQQSDQGQCGRWVDDEELYAGVPTSQRRNLHELETDTETWLAVSSVSLLCVLASATLAMIHMFKSVKQSLCGGWKKNNPLVMV